jgi:F0F1-type ATP synthase membrane subunit b/b'
MGSTVVGSTVVGSTEAALDDAAQTIAATRANLVAASRKQVVTEALSEALQTIESAKANLMYGAEGGTKALQQNLEQAITELEAAMSSRDRRLISGLGKRVDELTAPFAQRRIERDIKLALEGHSADEVSAQLGA